MKKTFKKLITSLLVTTMVCAMTVSIYALDTKQVQKDVYTVKYNEADSTYDKKTKTFDIYFDIPEEAANYGSVKLDLSGAMVDGITATISMPGESYSFNINIRNQSGVDFSYKKGSYFLTEPEMTGPVNTYDVHSFTGKAIDSHLVPHRIASSVAIYKGLFEKERNSQVTGFDMATIDVALEKKGFTGDEALTNYLLKYYNDENKTNATKISELPTSALRSIFSIGINNSNFSMTTNDYDKLTEKQKSSIISIGNNKYRFRETEKQLAEYYYNYFYDWCVGVVMGKHVTSADANSKPVNERVVGTSSVVKVYNNVNGERNKQDEYIANTLTDEKMKNGQNATLLAGYVIDGPLTGNNAQSYDFGFTSAIELEKAMSAGDVTVTKTLDLSGYKNNDEPTFIFALTDSKGNVYYQAMSFKEGQTSQSIKFENIPLGSYKVEEIDTIRYEQVGEIPKIGTLTKENIHGTVFIANKKIKNNDFSDTNIVINRFKNTDNGLEVSQDYQGTQK